MKKALPIWLVAGTLCPGYLAAQKANSGLRSSTNCYRLTTGHVLRPFLDSSSSAAKQQDENHDKQNEADAAPAIVSDAGAHVVAAAAKQQQEHEKNQD